MPAPLAPIEACAAECPARFLRPIELDTKLPQKLAALIGHQAAFVPKDNVIALGKAVRESDAKPAGKMIVTGARPGHGVVTP